MAYFAKRLNYRTGPEFILPLDIIYYEYYKFLPSKDVSFIIHPTETHI